MFSDSIYFPHPKAVEANADHPLAGAFFVVEKTPGVDPEYPFVVLSMAADKETAHKIRAAYGEQYDDAFEVTVRDREWLADHLLETLIIVKALGINS